MVIVSGSIHCRHLVASNMTYICDALTDPVARLRAHVTVPCLQPSSGHGVPRCVACAQR